jgi:hypothetical protein
MPQIGEISRGLWLASAFGGHGFNTTAMAGELIARGIVEGDETWRLFAPYDLVWAGGTLGRVLVQVGYWAERAADLVKARLASGQTAPSTSSDTLAPALPPEVAVSPAPPAARKRKPTVSKQAAE